MTFHGVPFCSESDPVCDVQVQTTYHCAAGPKRDTQVRAGLAASRLHESRQKPVDGARQQQLHRCWLLDLSTVDRCARHAFAGRLAEMEPLVRFFAGPGQHRRLPTCLRRVPRAVGAMLGQPLRRTPPLRFMPVQGACGLALQRAAGHPLQTALGLVVRCISRDQSPSRITLSYAHVMQARVGLCMHATSVERGRGGPGVERGRAGLPQSVNSEVEDSHCMGDRLVTKIIQVQSEAKPTLCRTGVCGHISKGLLEKQEFAYRRQSHVMSSLWQVRRKLKGCFC